MSEDDADRSSSLLGSLYETAPLLRFSVTTMVVVQPSAVSRRAPERRARGCEAYTVSVPP